LFSEKRADAVDLIFWHGFLLAFAFEGIGKRFII
jgi:hypothetical protein